MLKFRRTSMAREIPLHDGKGTAFWYTTVEPILERLHDLDKGAAGTIRMPEQIVNPETRDQYLVNSLIEEAVTSSQLEGAITTRRVARELLRTRRRPRDISEQMIVNNFQIMRRISTFKEREMTKELLLEIHRLITDGTLEDNEQGGRFRRPDEHVVVGTMLSDSVLHEPPPAGELEQRVSVFCDFANARIPGQFLHPLLRSIILHFWLAYDHPFVDGNGRTARALFYWSMLRHGYWLCEYISISSVLRKAPARYARSFLYTESDGNDLTYFILHQLQVLKEAVAELHRYIQRKSKQLQTLEAELHGLSELNHRQRSLIGHALRHPYHVYTIAAHRMNHNVSYQTARTDLLNLVDRKLFVKSKRGKALVFRVDGKLEKKLRKK